MKGKDFWAERQRLLDLLTAEEGLATPLAPIGRRDNRAEYPLSFAQQRLWFLERLSPGTPAYHIRAHFELRGTVDLAALEGSLSQVVRRHEALRATFGELDGRPVQRLVPIPPPLLPTVDLRSLPAAARRATTGALAGEQGERPFDLSRGPLLRAALFVTAAGEHLLVLTLHHLVADGWSIGVLLRELSTIYLDLSAGRTSRLAELPLQYCDFASWQREWLQGERLDGLTSYWRERLSGAPTILELPGDRPRPAMPSWRGGAVTSSLGAATVAELRRLGQAEGATLFMVLLAAFGALLSRLTEEDDLLIGSPIANRNRPELEPLIGLLANTVVLRIELAGDPTVAEALAGVRRGALGAYDHQDLPFEKLLDDLDLDRELSHPPLCQVMLILQNAPLGGLRVPGLEISPRRTVAESAKLDLTVALVESGDDLLVSFEYSVDLFDRSTVARISQHFSTLAAALSGDGGRRLSELTLLTPAEGRQLLLEWNDTAVGREDDACLDRLFIAQAEATPRSVALVFEGRSMSYRELDLRSDALARQLSALEIGPEVKVGLFCDRSFELVVGLLATLKAGAAFLPLDPSYPEERLARMVADAAVPLLLVEPRLAGRLAVAGVRELSIDVSTGLPSVTEERLPSRTLPELAAYVIYTSGSTGQPKGVVNVHRAAVNRLLWMQESFALDGSDAVLQKTPSSFDVSVWEFLWPLLCGARLVLARPGGQGDSAYLAGLIAEQGITTLHFVPSMLHAFLDEPGLARCTGLRRVIASGEALSSDLARRTGALLPGELYNLYGPTEAAIDVTWQRASGAALHGPTAPIGSPIANLQIHLLDSTFGLVPVGVPGELYIGGVGLARCYLGAPALTAERFLPDPFAAQPGRRLYRTGDIVRRHNDGTLVFLGRRDQQVKLRGFRIELGEIEAALAVHPAVREAVVLLRHDGGEPRLVAYISANPLPDLEALREVVRRQVPEYMVPWSFVRLDVLPRAANGKVDRRSLPAPDASRPELAATFVAPRSEVEEVLAAIWAQVLGVEEVGVHDNFFALGGDSIRSIEVIAKARQRGIELTLQQIFQHQTLERLAQSVKPARSGPPPSRTEPFGLVSAADRALLPEDVEDAYPLAFLQAGMLYHLELSGDSPVYHNVNSMLLRAVFDRACFQAAADQVVRRHAILRTAFHLAGFSEALQLVHRTATLPIEVEDVRHLGRAEQEMRLRARIATEKQRRFSLSTPPLLRFHILLRSDETFQLTLTENHAIFDGWSLHATLNEIFTRYLGLLGGEPPLEEPVIAVTYRHFIHLEQLALHSAECERYWRETLYDCNLEQLPRPRSAGPRGEGPRMRSENLIVPRSVADGLRRHARESAIPLKSVLLAAHLKVLSLVSGLADVLTGLASNGRPEELDGEQVRGLFLNMVPLRLRLCPGSFRDLAKQVFAAEAELLPYRWYPMGALQQQWGDRALLETAFTYVHFHAVEEIVKSDRLKVLDFERAEQTHFPLATTFRVSPLSGTLSLVLDCDTRELAAEHIVPLPVLFDAVLRGMALHPDERHDHLSALTTAEHHRLLVEWNATRRDLPAGGLGALVAAQSRRTPDAIAVAGSAVALSYGELAKRARTLATRLAALGVGPEDRVGVCLERSVELIWVILGVLEAGAAYLPLDPGDPPQRRAGVLADARPRLVLTSRSVASRLTDSADSADSIDGIERVELEALDGPAVAFPLPPDDPRRLAYIVYTSGSSGRPKGVMVEHHAIVNRLQWMVDEFSFGVGDRVLWKTPFIFDASIWELFVPLLSGGAVVVASPGGHQDATYLASAVAEQQVTVLQLVPSMLKVLLDEPAVAGCTTLRYLFCGGEVLPASVARRGRECLSAGLCNLYGPTEAAIDATFWICPTGWEGETVPIGRPLANVRVVLLDGDQQLVPAGAPGDLAIGGAGLARGYTGHPDLTAASFLPDPFAASPGERIYRTGDRARFLPDGRIEFLGRGDRQVKLRGLRIELGEIEGALLRHPRIAEAAVVASEDLPGGRGLLAYVVARGEEALLPEALKEFLGGWLSAAMVPAFYRFLPALPRTPGGKLDRGALPALGEVKAEERLYVAPRTATEEGIAAIWRDVLGVEKPSIGDNFFTLGGQSLSVIQVISRARKTFEVSLSLRTLYSSPTIELLAQAVDEARQEGAREKTLAPMPAEAPAAAPPHPGGVGEPVEVDGLSAEQVDAMLNELLRDPRASA